jgi:hypothetical protein
VSRPEVLALIPARGGSKSVPRKNVLPIGGKPLIAHSIGHALECSPVTRTIVSTDDAEIAEVAARYGAERAPDTVRLLLTGHTDLDAAIAAVNEGHVFRFLTKPCPREHELAGTIAAQLRVPDGWHVEVAAMLSSIGLRRAAQRRGGQAAQRRRSRCYRA